MTRKWGLLNMQSRMLTMATQSLPISQMEHYEWNLFSICFYSTCLLLSLHQVFLVSQMWLCKGASFFLWNSLIYFWGCILLPATARNILDDAFSECDCHSRCNWVLICFILLLHLNRCQCSTSWIVRTSKMKFHASAHVSFIICLLYNIQASQSSIIHIQTRRDGLLIIHIQTCQERIHSCVWTENWFTG